MQTRYEFFEGQVGGYKHLEAHFADMAARGWMLTKIHLQLLKYERCEPQTLQFFVDAVFFAKVFEYPLNDDVATYRLPIEQAGWKCAAAHQGIHVFYKPAEYAVTAYMPTEEAPPPHYASFTEQCHAAMRTFFRAKLLGTFITVGYALFMGFFISGRFGAGMLHSNLMIFMVLGLPIVLAAEVLHVLTGSFWFVKTWRAGKRNEPPYVLPRWLCGGIGFLAQVGTLVFVLCVIVGVVMALLSGTSAVFLLVVFAVPLVSVAAFGLLQRRLNASAEAREDKVGSYIVTAIGVFIASFIFIAVGNRFFPTPVVYIPGENAPSAITMADLHLPAAEGTWLMHENTSIAVPVHFTHRESWQRVDISTRMQVTAHERIARILFNYEVTTLQNFNRELLGNSYEWMLYRHITTLPPGDAARFGADEAVIFSGFNRETFILRRGNIVVTFNIFGSNYIDDDLATAALRNLLEG